jgi:hypothetical protein
MLVKISRPRASENQHARKGGALGDDAIDAPPNAANGSIYSSRRSHRRQFLRDRDELLRAYQGTPWSAQVRGHRQSIATSVTTEARRRREVGHRGASNDDVTEAEPRDDPQGQRLAHRSSIASTVA